MKPEDIVTAVNASGATITTDGEHVTVSPPKLVQPMVMAEARANRDTLLSHLLATGRVSADGVQAAGARRRLVKGREMLFDMEQRGDTEGYERFLNHYETVLHEYERFCHESSAKADGLQMP